MKGLEPLLREKLDPKSSASTNSATPAILERQRYNFSGNYTLINQFLTSKASRNAFPMSMNANTNSMMAIPGRMAK